MRHMLAICLALLAASLAHAQSPQPPRPADYWQDPGEFADCAGDCFCPPALTVRLEYLMWWSRGRNVPPLATTSPNGTPRDDAGVLGIPGTSILYGNEPIGEDFRSGGRLSLSHMVADCLWAEGRLWGLEDSSESFFAASNGDPILAVPFFNAVLGQEDAVLIAFPGVTTNGSIAVRSHNDLFGADAWIRETWSVDCGARIDLLYGYQFTRLDDSLAMRSVTTSIDPGGTLPVGTVLDVRDAFATQNEFHGGQL